MLCCFICQQNSIPLLLIQSPSSYQIAGDKAVCSVNENGLLVYTKGCIALIELLFIILIIAHIVLIMQYL